MEISLIFLFIVLSLILVFLGYLFSDFNILTLATILILSIGLIVLGSGYDTYETSTSNTDLIFIYNNTLNQTVLKTVNTTSNKLLQNHQDFLSLTAGFLILGTGAIMVGQVVFGRRV